MIYIFSHIIHHYRYRAIGADTLEEAINKLTSPEEWNKEDVMSLRYDEVDFVVIQGTLVSF